MARYKPSIKILTHGLMGTYNVRRMSSVGTFLHKEFVACLLNVETRVNSCELHSTAFTESIESHIANLKYDAEEAFQQDHHLFGFFFNGLAAMESSVYGLAIMIGMSFPKQFPLKIPNTIHASIAPGDLEPMTLRDLNIKDVAARLKQTCPNDQLSQAIEKLNGNDTFNKWVNIRNIFSHRGIPNRNYVLVQEELLMQERNRKELHQLSRDEERRLANWEANNRRIHVDITEHYQLVLNGSTTTRRLEWLDKTLKELILCGQQFIDEH